MAFAIKNFNTIAAQLVIYVSSYTTALTDFNIGSKTRTILEAFAESLESFYLEMFRGIQEGIDAGVYNSFDFPPLPAKDASGNVLISLFETGTTVPASPTTNINIPVGFQFQIISTTLTVAGSAASGTIYAVTSATTWLAGQTSVLVPVACITAGTIGNTSQNTITGFVSSLPVIVGATYTVTNPVAFINGTAAETNAQQQIRFSNYLQSLGRATVDALQYAALQGVVYDQYGNIQEQVAQAIVIEPYLIDGALPTAYVTIYIYNGTTGASQALVNATQNIINGYFDANGNRIAGYKAAGVIVTVLPVVESVNDFIIDIVMASGYSFTSTIQNSITTAISQYVNSLAPGATLLYNELIAIVMNNPSIYDCYIVKPSADVILSGTGSVNVVGNIVFNVVTSIVIEGEESEITN